MVDPMMMTSSTVNLTRDQRIDEAIARLDDCAGRLENYRDELGEEMYADLVSQAYFYASFLTDCKAMGVSLQDPRLREAANEMNQFCNFLEEEMPL